MRRPVRLAAAAAGVIVVAVVVTTVIAASATSVAARPAAAAPGLGSAPGPGPCSSAPVRCAPAGPLVVSSASTGVLLAVVLGDAVVLGRPPQRRRRRRLGRGLMPDGVAPSVLRPPR